MDKSEFRRKIALIEPIAQKYNWIYLNNDLQTFRVSYTDELAIWRIDIYLSKMTVCLIPKGSKPMYYKRTDLEHLEKIFKNPYKYET